MSFLLLPQLSYALMMGTSKGPRITILNPHGAENMEKNKIVRIPKGKVYIQSLKTVDSKKKDPVVQTQSVNKKPKISFAEIKGKALPEKKKIGTTSHIKERPFK
ncbi:hypothetical protein [Methylacidiphilum kamchatkense]|uniref:hypothetical protein n=1 Tax=Methylacidiphilum kamchatkense TaxID=431057 RepID=UPI0012699014|nr:hypothetical protein [Methylacidiphilum kamchatkense]